MPRSSSEPYVLKDVALLASELNELAHRGQLRVEVNDMAFDARVNVVVLLSAQPNGTLILSLRTRPREEVRN